MTKRQRFDYDRFERERALGRAALAALYRSTMDAATSCRSEALAAQYREAARKLRAQHQLTDDEVDGQLPLL